MPSTGPRRPRPKRLPALERREQMAALLEQLRADSVACTPAEFCHRIGITRPALARYPEIAAAVNAYGWESASHRMRGQRPGEAPSPTKPRTAGAERLRREHEEMGRTLASSQSKIAGLTKELDAAHAALHTAQLALARRDRVIEHLITRLAGTDPTACREAEAALKEVAEPGGA